jgi:hypothetical protein
MLKIEIILTKPQLKLNRRMLTLQAALLALVLVLSVVPRSQADSGNCSGQTITLPFTDVMGNPLFCSIAQIFFQGITLGTTATTYSPGANVTRDQMAAFLARTQNSVLNRGSRRAVHNQFWTTTPQYTVTQGAGMLGTTTVGSQPQYVASDGADIWVVNANNTVTRVRASDGKNLETWTGAVNSSGVLVAMGRVFVLGQANPGFLYVLDPSQPFGSVNIASDMLGNTPVTMAFDGARIWTANNGSVSIVTPGSPNFTVNNITTGFGSLLGIVHDGANIWVAEIGSPGSLKKLDANGAIVTTATVGNMPEFPVFDGTNIWVPNNLSDSVSVVRATDGTVLATLTGNGLNRPYTAAFDGQRILVTNFQGNSVSLWRAADFAPLGSFSTGASSNPFGACSDGLQFWIALRGQNQLGRF